MELAKAQDPQLSDQNQVHLGSGQVGKGRPWVPWGPAGTAPLLRVHLRPSLSSCYVLSSTEPYPALMSLEAALTSSQGSPPRTPIHGHGPTQHPWKPKSLGLPPFPWLAPLSSPTECT